MVPIDSEGATPALLIKAVDPSKYPYYGEVSLGSAHV
jgi:hypothetical protein